MHTEGAPAWIFSPFAEARWSTVLTLGALFILVTWKTRRPVVGLVAAMAWLSGFEILYQATGAVLHHWSVTTLVFTTAGTGGWLIAAYTLGVRLDWRTASMFVALWVVWIALGFDSNMPDRIIAGADRVFSWRDELLNVGTKTVFGVVIALGVLKAKADNRQVRAV